MLGLGSGVEVTARVLGYLVLARFDIPREGSKSKVAVGEDVGIGMLDVGLKLKYRIIEYRQHVPRRSAVHLPR